MGVIMGLLVFLMNGEGFFVVFFFVCSFFCFFVVNKEKHEER